MERRDFFKKGLVGAAAVTTMSAPADQQQEREIYEMRMYELRWGQQDLDKHLSTALIPALNRAGVKKVGVFTEWGRPEPGKVYLFNTYQSLKHYGEVTAALSGDSQFTQASQAFDKIGHDNAPYARYESSLMMAFTGFPKISIPPAGPKIFELRTYESATEDAYRRKVHMFNNGEFDIFNRVKLLPVFFGEVLIGKSQPCLTYMIHCPDMEQRDKNWKDFGEDPAWVKLRSEPMYQNTVSRIQKTFLVATSYSQI